MARDTINTTTRGDHLAACAEVLGEYARIVARLADGLGEGYDAALPSRLVDEARVWTAEAAGECVPMAARAETHADLLGLPSVADGHDTVRYLAEHLAEVLAEAQAEAEREAEHLNTHEVPHLHEVTS